jgi:hypothetical protein
MSRRQRRKSAAAGGAARGRWVIRGLVGCLGLGVIALGGGYVGLRSWLHGEDFRQMLSKEAGKALGVTSEFGPFQWDGTRMDTTGFKASGEGIVRSIDAEGLRVEMGLGGWWEGVWRVEDARARRIEVEIDATAADRVRKAPQAVEPPVVPKPRRWYDSWIPQEVEVRQLEVSSSSLKVITKSGPVGIAGTGWRVTPDGAQGSYRAEGSDGTVQLPWKWAPPMELGRARLRYQGDAVFLTAADFRVYESGKLDLSGEMSVKGEGYVFNGDLRDVKCAEVLPEDWKQRLAGKIDSQFTVEHGPDGPLVEGSLELTDGVLTAMPLLDSLSAYADTTRFRRLALQDGRVDYEWEDGVLNLRNLVIASEGLVRLEGTMRVDAEERLDGRFRLGLVPGVLARIPGAETIVFQPGERGLLWTTLRVTGTVDDPEEDLTARLIEAAGLRMFEILPETGERVLKFTRQVLDQDLTKHLEKGAGVIETGRDVIETGRDVIREAEGVVRGVGGIFGVLGGDEPKELTEEELEQLRKIKQDREAKKAERAEESENE